jgi:creatinine amidohydrolase
MVVKYLNILESFPHEVEDMIKESPIAYIPMGSIEWHGPHNILGVDSLKVIEICKRTVETTGGVLFPCINWGAFNTMNFPFTYHFSKRAFKKMTKNILKQSYDMGFRIVILISGHYPSAQIKQLMKNSRKYSKKYSDFFALGIPEQKLVPDLGYFGDHAAHWETSMTMALNPSWVSLEKFPEGLNFVERGIKYGVFGKDPRLHASKELGEKILDACVERLSNAVLKVKKSQSIEPFEEIYTIYNQERKKIFSLRNLRALFKSQGIKSTREGIEFFKWMLFKKKKANPDYQYPEKYRKS